MKRPVVVKVGSGSGIPTVHFSRRMIQHHGANLVRINLAESKVQREQDVGLTMRALEAMEVIDAALAPDESHHSARR